MLPADDHVVALVDTVEEQRKVTAAIHDRVTANHVHGAGNREKGDVLGQYFSCVLGTDKARFEHCETGGHPHDQGAANKKIKSIESVLKLKNLIIHSGLLKC